MEPTRLFGVILSPGRAAHSEADLRRPQTLGATSPGRAFNWSRAVDATLKSIIWQQFGATIDMLENAMRACPDSVWHDRSRRPEFWYVAYHALFFLDYYLSDSVDDFVPPTPFTLEELDSDGVLPAQPYTKEELLAYVGHGREKCRATIISMTADTARQRHRFSWGEVSRMELLFTNMRHVQHHAAQLNLILRQTIDSAPRWVAKATGSLDGG